MPNVLFVMTGRNVLDWGKSAPIRSLKYGGGAHWPRLAGDASTSQFLVGSLSPTDSEEYLRQRLTTAHGEPAIVHSVRERIVAASEGLPLYLELSAEYYDEVATRSAPPRPDEFGLGLPQLVTRVTRDMDDEERRLLRAAALVRAFDRALLKAAVPSASDASVNRFLLRTFVRRSSAGWLLHSIHETLRDSVREHDTEMPDAWSADEWRETAARIVSALGSRWQQSSGTGALADRPLVIGCFLQAGWLANRYDLAGPWLVDVAYALREMRNTEAFEYLESLSDFTSPEFAATRAACLGVYRRLLGELPAAEGLLRNALSGHLPTAQAERTEVELAEVLLRQNIDDEARTRLERLATPGGSQHRQAAAWLAVLDERHGRFERAAEWARGPHPDEISSEFAENLLGHVLLAAGRFLEAEEQFRTARERAQLRQSLRGELLMLQDEAWAIGFADPIRARPVAQEAYDLSVRFGNESLVARARSRIALSELGTAALADVLDDVRLSYEALDRSGYHSDCVDPLLVQWLASCLSGDRQAAIDASTRLAELVRTYGAHRHMLNVGSWWEEVVFVGERPTRDLEGAAWLDGDDDDVVRHRWLRVLDARRAGGAG